MTKDKIAEIDRRTVLIHVPAGVGRLPGQIGSQYCGFTAKQWKKLDFNVLPSGVERYTSQQ